MPKNILFYFSGTGNSLSVAKSIGEELGDFVLVPILSENALDAIVPSSEKIGLIFPIHMNSLPHVVEEFIKLIKLPPSVYFFVVVTHGGVPGMTRLYINRFFKTCGLRLDGYYEVKMINNTPKGVAPKMLMNLNWETTITPEIIDQALAKSALETKKAVQDIKNKKKTTLQSLPTGLGRLAYWMMSFVWWLSKKSKPSLHFFLDEDFCTGCQICANVCTSQRIKMNGNKPEWSGDHCNFCYACFNYCPSQAIGVEHYLKMLGRYHHPAISANEIANQIKAFAWDDLLL
jgi:Pyruvate/2-oxoacid:ferredoxin oxidoreductase delta subunit/flavodoxin